MRICRLLLAFSVLTAVAALCHAAEDASRAEPAAPARSAAGQIAGQEQSQESIAALIRDLGSEEYVKRERASERLAAIGLPAYSALQAAASDPDREVRYRAQRILGQVRQQDMERRLEAFLRGQDEDDAAYPLPGWQRFKKTYGEDAAARKLFVAMQRADAELLAALDESPRVAADLLTQRTLLYQQTLQLRQDQLSLGEVATTLFVAAEKDVELPPSTMMMIFSYCDQPGFRDVLSGSSRLDLPRQMLGSLITRSEDLVAYQAMNIAFRFDMAEGLVPAVKILEAGGNNRQPHMIQIALMTVSRLGDASHLPLVEKLMADTSLLTRMQEGEKAYDVQVRDAALAAAVMLTRQKLGDYFELPGENLDFDPQMVFFNARMIGFTSDEKRAAVFAKWEKYKARLSKRATPAAGAKPRPAGES